MVPVRLAAARAAAGAGGFLALSVLAGCGDESGDAGVSPESAAAGAVRERYRSTDAAAAGAWTWSAFAEAGAIFVLVDVQSTVEGLVQARADLWLVTDSGPGPVGRSDVMPAAARFGAFAFDDLTGDGLPDLFGYVADSAGVQYPVFIPGAQGSMREELSIAAPGWRFDTEEPRLPGVIRSATGACALSLYAEAPAPDRRPEGWRYVRLLPGGGLSAPTVIQPSCD